MRLIGQDEEDTTRLLSVDKIRFRKETRSLARVRYAAEAKAGGTALGGLMRNLEECVTIALIPIFSVPGAETKDGNIAVSKVSLDLWVNRSYLYHIEKGFEPPEVVADDMWFKVDLGERGLHEYAISPPPKASGTKN